MAEDTTRESWNIATRNHNAHKGDQGAFLRGGGDTLFAEELDLLGDIAGRDLVHLQCNAGQDTLCLARRGARVTGVDFSDEAIAFARNLSDATNIAARFECEELLAWMASTTDRFDIAFSSYGAVGWLKDIGEWARGIARILRPGGHFTYVEFHPVVWSIGEDLGLSGDNYFQKEPFCEPVGDYVAASGAGLGAVNVDATGTNDIPATSWQHTVADILTALIDAGLAIERFAEYPYSNGCRVHSKLIPTADRRYAWPEGTARVPLMFGLRAKRPR